MDDGDDDDDDDSNSTIVYPKPHFQSNLSSLHLSAAYSFKTAIVLECRAYAITNCGLPFLSPADSHVTAVELRV